MVAATESGGGPLLPNFFAGRSIFITGGSGFLGKVLIERLLWTCPDVHELHLLMRDKRGEEPLKRLTQLKQSPVFDNIRERCPWQLDKLRVVSGDVSKPHLGLDDTALTQLQEVSVVFHNAATIKFWETLDTALHQNVTSVIALMDLCDQLPKLEALVHVSTAYSNAEHHHIEERVYPAPAQLDNVRAVVGALPPPLLHEITERLITPKPNTYIFTKAVAESMIDSRPNRRYAAAIVRPSIVVSSARDPYPGWIENLSGPSGVIVGYGKGLLHAFNLNHSARADLVPVDVTIDTMIAVAWEISTDKSPEVRVYNSSSQENPITWGFFQKAIEKYIRNYPLENGLYYPCTFTVKNRYLFKIMEMLLQTVPLYVAHYIAKACGVKMQLSLVTVSERLQAMSSVLAFFATRDWTFSTDNVQRLRDRLSPQDRDIYNLDVRDVDWDEHVSNSVHGTRKYLLKEMDDNIPQAKKHFNRLRFVHYMILLVLTVLLYRFLTLILSKFVFNKMAL